MRKRVTKKRPVKKLRSYVMEPDTEDQQKLAVENKFLRDKLDSAQWTAESSRIKNNFDVTEIGKLHAQVSALKNKPSYLLPAVLATIGFTILFMYFVGFPAYNLMSWSKVQSLEAQVESYKAEGDALREQVIIRNSYLTKMQNENMELLFRRCPLKSEPKEKGI